MKKSRMCVLGSCLAIGPMLSGCSNQVLTNVAAGLRDGATTTAMGLIDTFFGQHFPDAVTTQGEEGGDDLFVRM